MPKEEVPASVSMRDLSHKTTRVLKAVEQTGRLATVARHGNIVAALIPTTAEEIVRRWMASHPASAQALAAVVRGDRDARPADELFTTTDLRQTRPSTVDVRGSVRECGVREFANSTAEVLRAVEEGVSAVLTRRNEVIAILVPFSLSDLVAVRLSEDAALSDLLEERLISNLKPEDLLDSKAFGPTVLTELV